MNTEKRVLELEKQLEKMRKLIKDDSDSSGNNNSKHYKFSSKSKNKQKSKQIIDIQPISQPIAIESDTTLQDVDPAFSDDSSSFDQQQQQQQRVNIKFFLIYFTLLIVRLLSQNHVQRNLTIIDYQTKLNKIQLNLIQQLI